MSLKSDSELLCQLKEKTAAYDMFDNSIIIFEQHIWIQQYQTCIRDYKHMHFFIWSFFKLVITAISSQLINITSLTESHSTVSE